MTSLWYAAVQTFDPSNPMWADYTATSGLKLDYLLRRIASDRKPNNVLAVVREPAPDDHQKPIDPRFAFVGYDLIERGGSTSSLTNCIGGFPLAYRNDELSSDGLLISFARAKEVQTLLRKHHPQEVPWHADTEVWAIWLMVSGETDMC